MNSGPERTVMLTCSLFVGNGNIENGRFFCLWQLFFRAVMSLPFSWSHKRSEVINGQQSGHGSFKDTGIMEKFPFQSICHQWWV